MFRFTLARKLPWRQTVQINWIYCKSSAVQATGCAMLMFILLSADTDRTSNATQHTSTTCVIVQRPPYQHFKIVNYYAIYWHFTMTNWIFSILVFFYIHRSSKTANFQRFQSIVHPFLKFQSKFSYDLNFLGFENSLESNLECSSSS